jgi:hypothetical protein
MIYDKKTKMNQRIIWVAIVGISITVHSFAQLPSNRLKPGTMYHPGDSVKSPRLGVSGRIPEGWDGVLPRDTEVFLLMPNTNIVGEMFLVVNEKLDLAGQRKRWEAGSELSPGLKLQIDGGITEREGNILSASGKVVGSQANAQNKVYLESKCSPYGFCLVTIVLTDNPSFERVKQGLQAFMNSISFKKPSNESPYKNFDWKPFLSGKVLLGINYEQGGKKEDEVDLCTDGTFESRITRTGIFKGQAKKYQGKKQGTWDVQSNGERATLKFTFEKLDPVEIEIVAKDEEIYVRDARYFVGESERCKSKK